MNYWLKNNLKGDYQIWIIVTLLLTMSLFVVTSAASMNMYKYGQGESHYLRKHIVIIVLSLLTLWFTHRFEYFKLRNYIRPVLLLSYVLVVYAYLYGPLINGTRRWINIPFLGTFQPSDLAKVALIIDLARMLAQRQNEVYVWKTFSPMLFWCVLTCAIIAPSSGSTALILLIISFMLMFIGRVPVRFLGTLVAFGAGLAFSLFILVSTIKKLELDKTKGNEKKSFVNMLVTRVDTYTSRIMSYWSADPSDQLEKSYVAIATGGPVGKAPGRSQMRSFLPQSDADFVYAIIIEEWGWLGAIFPLILYIWFLYRGMKAIDASGRAFGGLLSAGLTLLIVLTAMINMGTATGTIPTMGQNLPMISTGGTSMVFTALAIGIVLRVSMDKNKNAALD